MQLLKSVLTIFVLLLTYFTAHAQSEEQKKINAALEGSYVAKYGLFRRHAVDFRLINAPSEKGMGEVIMSLSEYPEFGNCHGHYVFNLQQGKALAIYTRDQLKCQGLLGEEYKWLTFVIEFPLPTLLNESAVYGKMQIRYYDEDTSIQKNVLIKKR